MNKNVKGMTLTEILIVTSIIAVSASLVIVTFRNQLFKGQDAKRKVDLKRIQTAVEEYYSDNDCYPTTELASCNSSGLSPYLNTIPCDPTTQQNYNYQYQPSICPQQYRLHATLEDDTADPDFYLTSPNYIEP